MHKFGDNLKKFNFQKLHSEFNNSEKLQIFCIYSEDYLLDIIIRLIPKKIEVRRNTFGQHLLTKWYEYIFSHKFQWKSKFLLRAGDLQILKVLIIPFQV